jgi:hypothetical protein
LKIVRRTQEYTKQLGTNKLTEASNNVLEFLAAAITIWMVILSGDATRLDCLLAMTDSSCAAGWMYKSSLDLANAVLQCINRKLGTLMMEMQILIHPLHLAGIDNIISDELTRCDEHEYDDELTSYLMSTYPSQVPENFRICPVPNVIKSWLSSIGVITTDFATQRQKHPSTKETPLGPAGKTTSTPSALEATSSSTPSSTNTPKQRSSPVSRKVSGRENIPLAATVKHLFSQGLSAKPLHSWHRNSGVTSGKAPVTSRMTQTGGCTPSSPKS